MFSETTPLMKFALAVLVVLMGAVFFWQPLSMVTSNTSIVNDFVLQTADGALDSKRLRGKVLAITFAYANCGERCSARLAKTVAAYDKLAAAERGGVSMILISVDPERDSPAAIARYAKSIHPDFVGATGKPAEIQALAAAFAADYRRFETPDGGYIVEPSPMTYVVAPDGRFVSVLSEAIPADKGAAALRSRLPAVRPPQ